MIPAVAYIRVSTKDQSDHGYSLPGQMADILSYAQRSHLEIVSLYTEDHTGLDLDRPELNKARQDLKSGKAKAIICHEDTRLSREPVHSVILRDEFTRLGVELHYALRGQINLQDYMHQAFEDIRARQAKEEVAKIVERTRRGKRTKVSQGNVIVAQRPPYGYRLDNGQLVVVEDEAQTVRQIFKWYTVDGWSLRRIADHLTALKVPTPADDNGAMYKKHPKGTWSKTFIRNILSRETYTGVWHWGKTYRERYRTEDGKRKIRMTPAPRENWIAVEVPPIIDHSTFELAQERFQYNVRMSKRATKREYLMSKRLVCQCGLAAYADARKMQTGEYLTYYHCASKNRNHAAPDCKNSYYPADQVDGLAWQYIKNMLAEPERMIELIEAHITQHPNKVNELQAELAATQTRIAKKEQALEKLYRDFLSEDDGDKAIFNKLRDELKADIAAAKKQCAELETRISSIPDSDDLIRLANTIRLYQDTLLLDNEPFEVKINWIEAFNLKGRLWKDGKVKKVTFTWELDELELSLGTPLPKRYGHNLTIDFTFELDSIVRNR